MKACQRPEAELRVTLILTGRSCRVARNQGSCEGQRMWIGNTAAREQLTNAWKESMLAIVRAGNGKNLNFYTECRNRVLRTVSRKRQLTECDRCEKQKNEEGL